MKEESGKMKNAIKTILASLSLLLAGCSDASAPSGGASQNVKTSEFEVPEWDGVYIVDRENNTIEVQSVPATHRNTVRFAGGYCSDKFGRDTIKVSLSDFKGLLIKNVASGNLNLYPAESAGFSGQCPYPEALPTRTREVEPGATYMEPSDALETGESYVIWENQTMWFIIIN